MEIRTGSVGLLVLFLKELAGLLPKNKFSISIGKADEDDVLRDIKPRVRSGLSYHRNRVKDPTTNSSHAVSSKVR